MVNSIFSERQEQGWVWRIAILALVCATTSAASAQQPYYSNQYKIFAQAPAARVARAPVVSTASQPFSVEFADPPVPPGVETPGQPFAALTKTFSANSSRSAQPTGKVQDIFGENPQGDAFGEDTTPPPQSPFQKVDPQRPGGQVPSNPFGEITPRQDDAPQLPGQNPFSELSSDPTPITPPMDTRPTPVAPQEGSRDPELPDNFTPNPTQIDPNPPIPGQRPSEANDPGQLPEMGDPDRVRPQDDEPSIFEGGDDKEIPDEQPDNSDVAPVPAPNSSRVYLPARSPTDYTTPAGQHAMIIPPGYYDPRMYANNNPYGKNPYANLPGPYGYAMPPQGFMPGMMPGLMPMPYGQCGPGCAPIGQTASSSNCNTCDSAAASSCGGCGSCGNCSSRPTLAGTEIVDIGDRIVETGCVDPCAPETYVEVVSDCDNLCSNYASCYIGVFGGLTDLNDLITRSNIGRGVYTDDSGYMFGLTIGQIQGRNLRTELELSYRNIGVNGLRLDGDVPSQFVGVNGDYGVFAGMYNGYWEFVDVRMGSIKPYIGGGIGFAMGRPNLIQSDGVEAVINSDDSSFAWQFMAGFNYKASPTLDAFVEYRYFTADSFRLDTEIPEVAGLGNGSGPFQYQASNVLFGLRARF